MSKFYIIPDINRIEESIALAEKYDLGFEFNDFYMPNMLIDENLQNKTIEKYKSYTLPKDLTSHGAFFDVTVFSSDPEIEAISKKRVIQSMEVARKIGAKSVIVHTNLMPFLKAEVYRTNFRNKSCDFYREVCKEFPELNLYLENMFDDDPYELAKIGNEMKDVPNFGICFDYAHAFLSETPIDRWPVALQGLIKHVHINDNDQVADLHQALGDGIIDWKFFMDMQKKYFPDATVLIETSSIENQIKSLEYAKEIGLI